MLRGQEHHVVVDLSLPVGQRVLGFGAEIIDRLLVIDAALAANRLAELVRMNFDPIGLDGFAPAVDVVVSDDAGRLQVGLQADHGAVALFGLLQLGDAVDDAVGGRPGEFFPE
jgi:hypothetical protein